MADFYYDLMSPYAWLSAERLASGGVRLEARWQPILLGAVFKATGRSSWASTELRADGIAEIERRAAAYGLPAPRWRDDWPGNSLAAMRAATYAEAEGFGREFALAAFRLAFAEGRDLSDAETVLAAAATCDREADVRDAIGRQEVKDALRENTDAAIARGVIGVPAFAVGDELLWGDDRLEEAAGYSP